MKREEIVKALRYKCDKQRFGNYETINIKVSSAYNIADLIERQAVENAKLAALDKVQQETIAAQATRLIAYEQEEKDGLLVRLPKNGMIYYIEKSAGEQWIGNRPIQDISFLFGWGLATLQCSIVDVGKKIFFSREAAEAALKEQEAQK